MEDGEAEPEAERKPPGPPFLLVPEEGAAGHQSPTPGAPPSPEDLTLALRCTRMRFYKTDLCAHPGPANSVLETVAYRCPRAHKITWLNFLRACCTEKTLNGLLETNGRV